jgi:hypothetical protein
LRIAVQPVAHDVMVELFAPEQIPHTPGAPRFFSSAESFRRDGCRVKFIRFAYPRGEDIIEFFAKIFLNRERLDWTSAGEWQLPCLPRMVNL